MEFLNTCSFVVHLKKSSACFYGALKLEVATLKIILDDVTTTTSCVVKWYSSIATYQNLGKINNNGKNIVGS
jgi:hypothetical protein